MRRTSIATNPTARASQLAALLLVGTGVFLALAQQLASGRSPDTPPPAAARAAPQTLSPPPELPHVIYRAAACGGDYVCDELGAWEIVPIRQAASPHLQTAEFGPSARTK